MLGRVAAQTQSWPEERGRAERYLGGKRNEAWRPADVEFREKGQREEENSRLTLSFRFGYWGDGGSTN